MIWGLSDDDVPSLLGQGENLGSSPQGLYPQSSHMQILGDRYTEALVTLWATISSPGHLSPVRPLTLLSILPSPMLCLDPQNPPNMDSTQSSFPTWPLVYRGLLSSTDVFIG